MRPAPTITVRVRVCVCHSGRITLWLQASEIEGIIRVLGLAPTKAKNVRAMSQVRWGVMAVAVAVVVVMVVVVGWVS